MGSKVTKINTNLNFVTLLYCNIYTQFLLNLLQNTIIYIILGKQCHKRKHTHYLGSRFSWLEYIMTEKL